MIIAVLNQKGEVGETTATLSLGAALFSAIAGVLLAVLDPQRDLVAYTSTVNAPNVTFTASKVIAQSDLLKREKNASTLLDCPPSLGEEIRATLMIAYVAREGRRASRWTLLGGSTPSHRRGEESQPQTANANLGNDA